MKTSLSITVILALSVLARSVFSAEPAGEYRVLSKDTIGGDGSWDYLSVDSEARRLYISRETRVIVFDMDTHKVIKEIEKTNGVHGVALVPEFNRGYISDGRDNTITIFDLKTLEKIGEAQSAPKPDAIVYDSGSQRVFAFNNGGTTATAIDAKTGTVVGQVELGGAPEFSVSDGNGHMYVNIEDKDEVVQFDPVTLKALNHWPLAPGKTPTGLAIDREHHRLFSGCRGGKLMVAVDYETGKVVATTPIGAGVDAAAFDPSTQTVFCSNGDGTLTVIHEDSADKYSVSQNVMTMSGARTMALDLKTHQIWLISAETKPAPESEPNKRKKTVVPNSFSVICVGK